MKVLVEFRTGDRVRLVQPLEGFYAGTEGEIARLSVAPTPACFVRIGDSLVEVEPEELERVDLPE
jgi:hypothetical protein